MLGCKDDSASVPFEELMQQLTDGAVSRKASTAMEARRDTRRRPQSARVTRSLDVEVDPFAHRRLLHPRDFPKGILNANTAEQIIRRGMPPTPKCTRPPPPYRTEAPPGGSFSTSAPVRGQRHLGNWDVVRCTAPERTWPSKGAVSRLYDERRQGQPPWKPSSSQSRELNPKVTLEVGMHGKAPEPKFASDKRVGRPQSAPPGGRQRPASARNNTANMQPSSEQQERPLSARSSQGCQKEPAKGAWSSQGCPKEPAKGASKQQAAPKKPTNRRPANGWAGG